MMGVLEGVVMELTDCALPLLREVIPTDNPEVAFKDVSAAFMVGSMPRKQGMERKDLLAANVKIFQVQGEALDKYARKDVKVLVVGNPANTNALVCSRFAPSIPKENFTAMTRLDQNRAQAQIANKLNVPVGAVSNVIIWGNHSSTQYPDGSHALVKINGTERPVPGEIKDDSWFKGYFLETVQKRGASVIAARKMSSAMSAAKAAADHMKDWFSGLAPGKFVSMAVVSDGSYGIPEDIVYSFPVTLKDGKWSIVKNLEIDSYSKGMMEATAKELEEERVDAFAIINKL